MKSITSLAFLCFTALSLYGQEDDLTAIYEPSGQELISHLIFAEDDAGYRMINAWTGRSYDLAESHPGLTLSGDFKGDGMDELAVFSELDYTPNMNPAFTTSIISIYSSGDEQMLPSGTWFSVPEEQLDLDYVSFSVARDFTSDGLDDIALFYNDPSSELLQIFLLESSGSGFSEPFPWFSVERSEFNFTAIKFACAGDFNGNGKPDIAVFYNYFGKAPETTQSIFLFEAEADSFTLLPSAYVGTKADFDFSNMKFALEGDYNLDSYCDLAVFLDDSLNNTLLVEVFEGATSGQLTPVEYLSIPENDLDPAFVMHAVSGTFAGDSAMDLVIFYDKQSSGYQEILVLENQGSSFSLPEPIFSTDKGPLSMQDITAVRSGNFLQQPLISVANWKDNRQGAVSFTFDDGYKGAFEHGGAELESAGLNGTFYIFTDTKAVYDGELANNDLISYYKARGHEIGSHTANHANLGYLTASGETDSLEKVLSESVELLNARFDQQTVSMSIPFGSFRHGTLEYLARYFLSARSSQFGFNLATPYDFYALRSWPVLSTTSPAYVDNLLSTAENFGTYLPLMYHDMLNVPFDEESLIYTYSREHFRETIDMALRRDLWIDTHERIYKYIRERNALKIYNMTSGDPDAEMGSFSFEVDDGLEDSVFNVELTLKIRVPDNWTEDTLTVGTDGDFVLETVQSNESGAFILYNWNPAKGVPIHVYEGIAGNTGIRDRRDGQNDLLLNVVPNPFRYECIISVSGQPASDRNLIVRDIHGRIIRDEKSWNTESYRFSREGLPPGMYIVQLLESGKQLTSLKILAR